MERGLLQGTLILCTTIVGVLVLATTASAQVAPCLSHSGLSRSGAEMRALTETDLRVLLDVQPKRIPISRPFRANVTVCGKAGLTFDTVRLNAIMPAHGHGMNYQADIKKVSDQHFVADRLLFHMPGVWRFEISLRANARTLRFTHDVTVE